MGKMEEYLSHMSDAIKTRCSQMNNISTKMDWCDLEDIYTRLRYLMQTYGWIELDSVDFAGDTIFYKEDRDSISQKAKKSLLLSYLHYIFFY